MKIPPTLHLSHCSYVVLYGINSANLELFSRILYLVWFQVQVGHKKSAQNLKGKKEAAQCKAPGTIAAHKECLFASHFIGVRRHTGE